MPENGHDARTAGSEIALKADLDAVRRSVVDVPGGNETAIPPTDSGFVLFVAQAADGILPWGRAPKVRDKQLREFIPTEHWFASALASVCARNAAFSWKLEGPDRLVQSTQEMMLNANRGDGFEQFVIQTTMDLMTQDNAAFIEIIRAGDSPIAPCINFAHLDAQRCYQTGNPEVPVIYQNRHGKLIPLPWYNVLNLHEMPSGLEHIWAGVFYKLQYCALTRLLRGAQILRDLSVYKDEKIAGRFVRAVHLLRGVSTKQVQDALNEQQLVADQQGLMRYIQPLMVSSVDPKADVDVKTVELASLPAGYDEDDTMKWYVAALALAFLTDYQEFAPLPGGGLGTSNQSQVLHAKSRGKGPGLFQKLFAHMFNFGGILPRSVTFSWDEQDIDADKQQAAVEQSRAEARKVRVDSGEIDDTAARELAVMAGDLPQEVFDGIEQRAEQRRQDAEQMLEAQARAAVAAPPMNAPDDRRSDAPQDAGPADQGIGQAPDERRAKTSPARLALEADVTDEMKLILDDAHREVRRMLRRRDEPAGAVPETPAKGRKRRVKTTFQKDAAGRTVGADQVETWG